MKHFLDLHSIQAEDVRHILDLAKQVKAEPVRFATAMVDKKLAMIFEKSSTRTRVSFELAMQEMGGFAMFLSNRDMQLGRGETIADTAKVMSRYVDAIMLRCYSHNTLLELADHASVPVVNGLTNMSHPCQLMADMLTIEEHCGTLENQVVAWIGDGNNMANSFAAAAEKTNFELRLACPKQLMPNEDYLEMAIKNGAAIRIMDSAEAAAHDADVIVTDTWVSMGDEDADQRMEWLSPYQVTTDIMSRADDKAIFMHCLPAHRGEEMTAEVIDGPQSVVWDEAENRLHVQKAILLWCLNLT